MVPFKGNVASTDFYIKKCSQNHHWEYSSFCLYSFKGHDLHRVCACVCVCVYGGWLIRSHKQDDPRWYQSSGALYDSLCYYRELKRWASDSAISFLLENKLSLDPFIKPCKAVPTVLTTWLYLASRYVLGNSMHVYLSLQALQLKPMSVKMRLTSVTNVFFWTQLLLGAAKKKLQSNSEEACGNQAWRVGDWVN